MSAQEAVAVAPREESAVIDTQAVAALRSSCGRVIPLHVDRWFDEPGPEEQRLLVHAVGPVLDVGCGPARHVLALGRIGVPALGIDVAEGAVAIARGRGAPVVHGSIFDPLPLEGVWGTALLLDGNVGIGGDPSRLLTRARRLLRSGGRALLEIEAPGGGGGTLRVRAERRGAAASAWFAWALVGADQVAALAHDAGFASAEIWQDRGRWFARLEAG